MPDAALMLPPRDFRNVPYFMMFDIDPRLQARYCPDEWIENMFMSVLHILNFMRFVEDNYDRPEPQPEGSLVIPTPFTFYDMYLLYRQVHKDERAVVIEHLGYSSYSCVEDLQYAMGYLCALAVEFLDEMERRDMPNAFEPWVASTLDMTADMLATEDESCIPTMDMQLGHATCIRDYTAYRDIEAFVNTYSRDNSRTGANRRYLYCGTPVLHWNNMRGIDGLIQCVTTGYRVGNNYRTNYLSQFSYGTHSSNVHTAPCIAESLVGEYRRTRDRVSDDLVRQARRENVEQLMDTSNVEQLTVEPTDSIIDIVNNTEDDEEAMSVIASLFRHDGLTCDVTSSGRISVREDGEAYSFRLYHESDDSAHGVWFRNGRRISSPISRIDGAIYNIRNYIDMLRRTHTALAEQTASQPLTVNTDEYVSYPAVSSSNRVTTWTTSAAASNTVEEYRAISDGEVMRALNRFNEERRREQQDERRRRENEVEAQRIVATTTAW